MQYMEEQTPIPLILNVYVKNQHAKTTNITNQADIKEKMQQQILHFANQQTCMTWTNLTFKKKPSNNQNQPAS